MVWRMLAYELCFCTPEGRKVVGIFLSKAYRHKAAPHPPHLLTHHCFNPSISNEREFKHILVEIQNKWRLYLEKLVLLQWLLKIRQLRYTPHKRRTASRSQLLWKSSGKPHANSIGAFDHYT